MKVKNTAVFNTSVMARHISADKQVIGGSEPESLLVPAGATLELADKEWKEKFAEPAKDLIESGVLKLVEAPALTAEEVAAEKAAEIEAAKALLEEQGEAVPASVAGLTKKG